MSLSDQQKLNQLLELANLLIYGQLKLKKGQSIFSKDLSKNKRNLQKITAREIENGISFNEDLMGEKEYHANENHHGVNV